MRELAVVTVVLAALAGQPASGQRIKLSASLADLEKAARSDSNDAAAHYNVALAYWNAKRWDDADSALHRATRMDPQFAAAFMALAGLPYARRPQLYEEDYENRVPIEWKPEVEESERMYRRAVMIDPLVEARIGYVLLPEETSRRLLVVMVMLQGVDWVGDYFHGIDLYFQGKYEDSYVRFQRVMNAIKAERHGGRVWNTLLYWHGLAAGQTRNFDDAVLDFENLLARYLDTEKSKEDSTLQIPLRTNEFRYILAVMKQRAGKFNEAIALYREALQNDIGLYMAHVRLAQIHEASNMFAQAVAERRAAVSANPEDASLLLDLGKTLARAGRWPDAEQALQDAVSANPRDPRPRYYLGIVHQQQNKMAEARTAFTEFIALAPSRYGPQVADAKQRLNALQ
ncbi:MAG: tetratricopeptide repeat protein [Gemmatimonadales bacterium]